MRIGIDARTLSGRYTGDRTYWRGLIGGLAAVDTLNEYFLYLREPMEGDHSWASKMGPNFHWRRIPWPSQDALWMLGSFPNALKTDRHRPHAVQHPPAMVALPSGNDGA